MQRSLIRHLKKNAWLPWPALLVACSDTTAPSYTIFGSFFPAWMICSLFGVIAAIIFRVISVATGFSEVAPFQLLFCVSGGVIAGTVLWLLWFAN